MLLKILFFFYHTSTYLNYSFFVKTHKLYFELYFNQFNHVYYNNIFINVNKSYYIFLYKYDNSNKHVTTKRKIINKYILIYKLFIFIIYYLNKI